MFGGIVTGSVLDCKKKPIELALQRYDRQLYLKWNPAKKDKQGCWEVRRKPTKLTAIHQGGANAWDIYTLEPAEHDWIHHILDVDVLDYRLLAKIKAMDTWEHKNWADHIETAGEAWLTAQEDKIREDLKYNIQQHRKEFKDWADLVARGVNPAQVLTGFTPTGYKPQNKE